MSDITRDIRGLEMRLLASLFGRPDVCNTGYALLSARSLREELPYGGFHCSLLPTGVQCFLFLLRDECWLFDPYTRESTILVGSRRHHPSLTILVVVRLPETPVLWVRDLVLLDEKQVGILDFGTRLLVCRRYLATFVRETPCPFGDAAVPGSLSVHLTSRYRVVFFPVFPLSCARWLWSSRARLPWHVDGLYFVRGCTSIGYQPRDRCLLFHWYAQTTLSVIVTAPGDVADYVLPPPYDGSRGVGTHASVLYVDDDARCHRLVPMGSMRTVAPVPVQSLLRVGWNPGGMCWEPVETPRPPVEVSTRCDARRVVALFAEGCVPAAALPSNTLLDG